MLALVVALVVVSALASKKLYTLRNEGECNGVEIWIVTNGMVDTWRLKRRNTG